MFKMVILVIRTTPILFLAPVFWVFSWIIRKARKIGSLLVVHRLTSLPFRLIFSSGEARALRNDLLFCMTPAVDILIEKHYGEGHVRSIVWRDLKDGLNSGRFFERERLSTGEFGISLTFTGIALWVIFYDVGPIMAERLSLFIGVASLILLFAVGTRKALMDTLGFDSPSDRGSMTEDTRRLV